ncbi:carboxypeptidase-like regulatory domain-containing protein, partial [Arsenicibacter rosenii]|uniref:carboxypeptidase-like regulatory domain-containing protein n=1 Tax=Arsenicibacter rosenii TaxID=1750698 RepID=UPI000A8AE288
MDLIFLLKRRWLLHTAFLFLSFLCVSAFAQNRSVSVSGKVTDETGKALPGVSVVVKSATTGTITNQDGVYTLSVKENATLVFSSISYETQEIPANNRSVIDVAMVPSNKTLNEVVVVGYGTQSKRAI